MLGLTNSDKESATIRSDNDVSTAFRKAAFAGKPA
jgi:hypothetical protein